jgi:hypothetical protein
MRIRRALPRPELALLLALAFAPACEQSGDGANGVHSRVVPGFGDPPAIGSGGSGFVRQTASSNPPSPAPASDVDPYEPWSALGELTGYYEVVATQIENDCTFGPDVPFDAYRGTRWGSSGGDAPVTQTYYTRLTQRGDAVVFELGEGIVLARWSAETGRLVDVERIGAEGVTFYFDGFEAGPASETDDRLLIAGESEWEFHDEYWAPGEICRGRAIWELLRLSERPEPGYRNLQFVLRWPAESRVDLDLMIRAPLDSSRRDEEYSHFAEVNADCYQLHAAGYAVADGGGGDPVGGPASGFVSALEDTALPYHEEIIRCAYAAYGLWDIAIVNWNESADVDFEIEVFLGPAVNTGGPGERSFGTALSTVAPLSMARLGFELTPPTSGGMAGLTMIAVDRPRRRPSMRDADPVTETPLGFNKAAYEGFSFSAFLEALGL